MTPEELLSWMEQCPVCGSQLLRVVLPVIQPEKYCPTMHGAFTVQDGKLVFILNTASE